MHSIATKLRRFFSLRLLFLASPYASTSTHRAQKSSLIAVLSRAAQDSAGVLVDSLAVLAAVAFICGLAYAAAKKLMSQLSLLW